MRTKPDMAAGTRSAALSINTSVKAFGYRRVSTPLGARCSVTLTTAMGRTKEIALVRHAAYAGEIVARLEEARAALEAAAELIARDREETTCHEG